MAITSIADLVKEAKKEIENLTPAQVSEEIKDPATVLIDLREPAELTDHGKIEGSVHAVRGALELYADPSSAFHNPAFDPEKRIILYCAGGIRSALAAQTLKQMGYTDVAHMEGGIRAWKEKGLPVV